VTSLEWYDLAADPAETRSADAPSEVRRRAIARWRRDRARCPAAPRVRLSAEQTERLRARPAPSNDSSSCGASCLDRLRRGALASPPIGGYFLTITI
jgi:hypothetical protein